MALLLYFIGIQVDSEIQIFMHIGHLFKNMQLFSLKIIIPQFLLIHFNFITTMKKAGTIKTQNQIKIDTQAFVCSQQQKDDNLLRCYPPHQVFRPCQYERVNELKNKYIQNVKQAKQEACNKENIKKSKHINWGSDYIEEHVEYIKNTMHVLSRQNEKEQNCNTNVINEFMTKVDKVNKNIEGKLSLLEDKLKQLRCKKILGESKHQTKEVINISSQKQFHDNPKYIEQYNKQGQSFQINQFLKRAELQKSHYVELKGKYKGNNGFPPQFILLVNRIKDQVYLDYQFTKIIITIDRKLLAKIKEYIKKKHPNMDLCYLEITPIQIDPLNQPKTQEYPSLSFEDLSQQLYSCYMRLQKNYESKLWQQFSSETIQIFVQELETSSNKGALTIGHLTSYLNMRTGHQFRNRALVKLLRRMNVCNSSSLEKLKIRQSFQKKNN